MQAEILHGMQQALQALQGVSASAGRQQPKDAVVDLASAALPLKPMPWTGPPHGSFLSYTLLQWAAARPAVCDKPPTNGAAAALLESLSMSLSSMGSNRGSSGNSSTGRGREPAGTCLFLPHPILLMQLQPQQQKQRVQIPGQEQEDKQQQGQLYDAGAPVVVKRLHTLQSQLLRCEQLMHCREILQQLLQVLDACRRTPNSHLLRVSSSESTTKSITRGGLCAAAAQTLRLAAFIVGSDKRRALCGVWTHRSPLIKQ